MGLVCKVSLCSGWVWCFKGVGKRAGVVSVKSSDGGAPGVVRRGTRVVDGVGKRAYRLVGCVTMSINAVGVVEVNVGAAVLSVARSSAVLFVHAGLGFPVKSDRTIWRRFPKWFSPK